MLDLPLGAMNGWRGTVLPGTGSGSAAAPMKTGGFGPTVGSGMGAAWAAAGNAATISAAAIGRPVLIMEGRYNVAHHSGHTSFTRHGRVAAIRGAAGLRFFRGHRLDRRVRRHRVGGLFRSAGFTSLRRGAQPLRTGSPDSAQ